MNALLSQETSEQTFRKIFRRFRVPVSLTFIVVLCNAVSQSEHKVSTIKLEKLFCVHGIYSTEVQLGEFIIELLTKLNIKLWHAVLYVTMNLLLTKL